MAHSSLCYMCFQIFRQWDSIISYFNQPETRNWESKHWDHVFQLESSAERGCGVCAQLLRGCRSTILLQGLKLRTTTILDIDPSLANGCLNISSLRLPALELELSLNLPREALDYSPYKDRDCSFRVTLVPYLKGDLTLNLLIKVTDCYTYGLIRYTSCNLFRFITELQRCFAISTPMA